MSKAAEFVKAKLALGAGSLAVSVPTLAFAFFGWSQNAAVPFGSTYWYVCVAGSLGAMILGFLLIHESVDARKAEQKLVKEPTLEFFVISQLEEEKIRAET